MPAIIIGQLNRIQGTVEMEWQISDFLSLTADENTTHKFRSPNFSFADVSWHLRIDVHGKSNDNYGYFGCYLMADDHDNPVELSCNLYLKKVNGVIKAECKYNVIFKNKKGYGCHKLLRRKELLSDMSDFVPSGILTLTCSLEETDKNSQRELCTRNEKKLIKDIKELMVNGYLSDLTIRIKDKEFYLHKNILKVRAPVFADMMTDIMIKNSTAIVDIEDFNEDTFRLFMDYLYSGAIGNLSTKNVFSLYELADKCEVAELKQDCMSYITDNLSAETFFDAYYLSEKYELKDVLKLVSKFCSDNLKQLMQDRGWIDFMEASAEKAYEMLVVALERYEKRDET